MQTRTALLAFAFSATIVAVGVGACSQTAPSSQSPDSAGSAAPGAPPAPLPGGSGAGATPSAAAAAEDDFTACKNATTKGGSVEIANPPPDGGVVMNNAQTAGDAGGSDRTSKIIDVVMQNRDKFRCCFDLWGRQNPGKEIKIGLSLDLKPSGELRAATFKPDETQLKDATVEKCMGAVASSLSFPESPSGKDTTYIHRFVFKSHK
jgi:hypothetical protein